MKKNSILLLAMTLIIAFCFTPSVMAKKVIYMGHEYDGKVNKEKIPEGKGTIQIAELSINGIFNGSVITDASFQTTWLSYKGDVVFYDNDAITLKDGGTITLNIYNDRGFRFDFNEIEHQDVNVDGDVTVNYQKLKLVPYQLSVPIEPLDERLKSLNPPTDTTINVLPEEHTYSFVVGPNNTIGEREYFIYSRNIPPSRDNNLRPYKGGLCATLNNYIDSEGRVWKRDEKGYHVTFPDGSYCSYKTGYERVSSDKSTFISDGLYKLILPNGVIIYEQSYSYMQKEKEESLILGNTAPYRLKVINMSDNGIRDNAESYVSGENKKIMVNENTVLEIYKGDGSTFNDYGRIKQIFNDSILPYLTIKEGRSVKIRRIEPDNTFYIALEYKDGVIKTEAQFKEEEDRAEADYEKSIASFKKKYGFDPSVDNARYVVKVGRNLIGVVDERNAWIVKYHEKLDRYGNTGIIKVSLEIDKGSRKCFNFYYNGYYCGYIWVNNKTITSVTWE